MTTTAIFVDVVVVFISGALLGYILGVAMVKDSAEEPCDCCKIHGPCQGGCQCYPLLAERKS